MVSKNGTAVKIRSNRTGLTWMKSPPKPSHCLQRPARWKEPSWPLHRAGLHFQYSKDHPSIFHLGGRPRSALNWWLDSRIYQAQVRQVTLLISLKCEMRNISSLATKIFEGLIKYGNLKWSMVRYKVSKTMSWVRWCSSQVWNTSV